MVGMVPTTALPAPGGALFEFCPRYAAPFYLSPSTAHLSPPRRVGLAIQVLRARLRTLLTGEPAFPIHHDPAIFHGPFARDRDAVHWVSRLDLAAFFRAQGAVVADLSLPAGGKGLVGQEPAYREPAGHQAT